MTERMDFSELLFACPSFVGGMAKCLDIGSIQDNYNESPTEDMADYNALMSDWMAVGSDMNIAIESFAKEHGQNAF